MPFLFFNPGYLLFMVPALLLALFAQWRVSSTYRKYAQIRNLQGLTGADVARVLMRNEGLDHVSVEMIPGDLTDHYDPRGKVMRLSEPVGNSSSVAAIAVAAHETGHAFQDAKHDASFRLRSSLVPAVGFASNIWMIPFFLGFFAQSAGLIYIAIALFACVVAFSLVTLPVEFGASKRAMSMLTAQGIITPTEAPVARRVLTAAAFTYVVAALISIIQIVYLIGLTRR